MVSSSVGTHWVFPSILNSRPDGTGLAVLADEALQEVGPSEDSLTIPVTDMILESPSRCHRFLNTLGSTAAGIVDSGSHPQ